jgi:sugar phosphate isomerase/epimerase
MYDIQFAASTYVPEGETEDLDEAVRRCAEAGFAGIELDTRSIADESRASYVRDLCYKHQIAPISAVLACGCENTDSLEEMKSTVDRLDGLGAEYLILKSETDVRPASSTLSLMPEVTEFCAEVGMKCSLELSAESFRSESADTEGEIGVEGWGFVLPVPSLIHSGSDPTFLMKKWGDRCNYLSFDDTQNLSTTFMQKVEAALGEIGFAGWAVVRPSASEAFLRPDALRELKAVFKM